MTDRVLMEFLNKYIPLVSRISYRIMCDRKDSEYITVRVMLDAIRNDLDYNGDVSNKLLRRTCRLCRMRLIKKRILQIFLIHDDVFVASSPIVPSYDEYVARQAWQVFCRASGNFTDFQRLVYTLCELECLPIEVAASILSCRKKGIERSLRAARETVAIELGQYGRIKDYDAYAGFIRKVEDQLIDLEGIKEKIRV